MEEENIEYKHPRVEIIATDDEAEFLGSSVAIRDHDDGDLLSLNDDFADPEESTSRWKSFWGGARSSASGAWRFTKRATHASLKWVLGGGKLITGAASVTAFVMSIRSLFYLKKGAPWLAFAPALGAVGALVFMYRPRNNNSVEEKCEKANFWWDTSSEVSEQFALYFLYAMSIALKITKGEYTTAVVVAVPIVSSFAAVATEGSSHYIENHSNPNKAMIVTDKILQALKHGSSNSAFMELLGHNNAGLLREGPILISAGVLTVLGGINKGIVPCCSKTGEQYGDAAFELLRAVGRPAFLMAIVLELTALYNKDNVPTSLLASLSVLLFTLYVLPSWYAVGKYYSQKVKLIKQALPANEQTGLLTYNNNNEGQEELLGDAPLKVHDIRKVTVTPYNSLVKIFRIWSNPDEVVLDQDVPNLNANDWVVIELPNIAEKRLVADKTNINGHSSTFFVGKHPGITDVVMLPDDFQETQNVVSDDNNNNNNNNDDNSQKPVSGATVSLTEGFSWN